MNILMSITFLNKHMCHDKHDHMHGAIDPALLNAESSIWAVKCSLIVLSITAIFQDGLFKIPRA